MSQEGPERPERPERTVWTPPESAGEVAGRGRLKSRRVLVVGAGQQDFGLDDPPIGNGRAMAVLFAREGASVAAADRDEASVTETVSRIIARRQVAVPVIADVRDPAAVSAMVAEAAERLGGLDGVVYNVGIGDGRGLAGTTPQVWDEVFAVNLRGALLTMQAALPVLEDASSVVLISSVASLKPGTGIPAYDASKAAMAGLMRHAALEGAARWIRVNVVAPGLMDTPLGRFASRGRASRATTSVPLARQGTGWETAYAALFLLSDEAAYITGQVLVVDGGLTALR